MPPPKPHRLGMEGGWAPVREGPSAHRPGPKGTAMSVLTARGLRKRYGAETVLDGVDLQLRPGTTLAVLGASGSGKSTLLGILAGLEAADAGQVWVDGRDVTREPPERRQVVYLYQEALLFPHLTAYENVAFGLRVAKLPRAEIAARTRAMLERLALGSRAHRMPNQLSGGQRQRVAFGRALVLEPRVLLLDEPFGALDPGTRDSMQRFFREVVAAQGTSTVFVTHDLKEALRIGDDFARLSDGKLSFHPDRQSFLRDPRVGALEELRFWQESFGAKS